MAEYITKTFSWNKTKDRSDGEDDFFQKSINNYCMSLLYYFLADKTFLGITITNRLLFIIILCVILSILLPLSFTAQSFKIPGLFVDIQPFVALRALWQPKVFNVFLA